MVLGHGCRPQDAPRTEEERRILELQSMLAERFLRRELPLDLHSSVNLTAKKTCRSTSERKSAGVVSVKVRDLVKDRHMARGPCRPSVPTVRLLDYRIMHDAMIGNHNIQFFVP